MPSQAHENTARHRQTLPCSNASSALGLGHGLLVSFFLTVIVHVACLQRDRLIVVGKAERLTPQRSLFARRMVLPCTG
jgi:hypothetical protein